MKKQEKDLDYAIEELKRRINVLWDAVDEIRQVLRYNDRYGTSKRLVCDNTILPDKPPVYTDDKVVPKIRIIDEESNNEKQK